ncbi:MAG: Glu-tRNA(Gln) amidotransferase subunit GatE [Methanomicrobiales archaeon]|nr:Glu-tRNA(Gln) amidotransferase subunit GatE [Methanomicrobiales archaeon]
MDSDTPSLTAGIEIHQQLDTERKLFCRCPTRLRDTGEHSGEFTRFLRATESEMGEIDRAALEELKHVRRFTYYTYDSTCLVEDDEEPPQPLNAGALEIALSVAKIMGMTPVRQVHPMRKLVIDGSNTCGFQRTALVALAGRLPDGTGIETICLEEDAAQRVEEGIFSLDRLGIPLVEITTAPDMHTPEAVQATAEYIGMVLRSTGRVKRGLGTIRQDVNISIAGGARVEIKGVQELDLIAEVVRREVTRQQSLLAICGELRGRKASVEREPQDITALTARSGSRILSRAPRVLAVVLRGFAGLVGREIQPGRRLGSEMADYAKRCGVGGIFHTDELPAYGITAAEVKALRSQTGAGDQDCVVLVAGTPEQAGCAAQQVIRRVAMAMEGVPEETRRMLPEGSTAYMRPLPGAARMYPETDVLPVTLDEGAWDRIPVPELLSERAGRFAKEYGLDPAVARQIAFSERLPLFERAVTEGVNPRLAHRALIATPVELARKGTDLSRLTDSQYLAVLQAVSRGKTAKEAVPDLLSALAAGKPESEVLGTLAATLSPEELDAIVARVLKEREGFVKERGKAALGPLMGVVMAEVRGRVDGKLVSEALKRGLEKATK